MLPALALVHACGTLVVEADETDLRETVQSAFEARSDVDTCAHVTLTTRGAGTVVTVTLPDGRRTTRVVPREEVVDALEPLLVVPAGEPEPETVVATTAPAVTFRVEAPEPVVIVVEHDEAPRRLAPAAKAKSLNLEASLALGLRTANDRPGAGIGMIAMGDSNGWLGGVEGRFDRYDAGVPTDPRAPMIHDTQALSASALVGRRARLGFVSLDVYGGAGVARLWAGHVAQPAEDAAWRGENAVAALFPQFRLGTRLTLRARSLLRIFLAVDGDARLGDEQLLPRWSAGAALGLTVGS